MVEAPVDQSGKTWTAVASNGNRIETALMAMRFHRYKQMAAKLLNATTISDRMVQHQSQRHHPSIRAVNYHGTPAEFADKFESHLQYFSERFVNAGPDDVMALHENRWPHDRPGILISFDDGLRNNFDVAAPLLETYGFCGWFFVPSAFPETTVESQLTTARKQRVELGENNGYEVNENERLFVNWEEVRQLTVRHVVGCHTMNHVRLRSGLSEAAMRKEIVDSKQQLERELGSPIDTFSWVGGQTGDYSRGAAKVIREAGYRFGCMTNSFPIRPQSDLLQMHRTHIESHWDLSMVRFQLSGIIDYAYRNRRNETNELTHA